MKISEIIYKKVVHGGADMEDKTLSNIFKSDKVYQFRVREDGALLMAMAGATICSDINRTNKYVFKIQSGLKDPQFIGYRWIRKRTSIGYIMGLKANNRLIKSKQEFTEIFNELDTKMIRAARDSMLRKM